MPADLPRPAQDGWCDVEGSRIFLFGWIEQVAECPEQGALFSRLRQRGQVVGRGPELLYVRFHGEGQLIGVPPRLVRLLDAAPGGC